MALSGMIQDYTVRVGDKGPRDKQVICNLDKAFCRHCHRQIARLEPVYFCELDKKIMCERCGQLGCRFNLHPEHTDWWGILYFNNEDKKVKA